MYNFFLQSSAVGHLGCICVLAIVNSAAVNTCLFELWFSKGSCPVVGLLGHILAFFLVFKGISTLFSIVVVSIYIPTNSARGLLSPHILSSIYCW